MGEADRTFRGHRRPRTKRNDVASTPTLTRVAAGTVDGALVVHGHVAATELGNIESFARLVDRGDERVALSSVLVKRQVRTQLGFAVRPADEAKAPVVEARVVEREPERSR